MEKHITTIADFLRQIAGNFECKEVSTDEGIKHCLETSFKGHGQELKDLLLFLNKVINPYFILIEDCHHIEDEDREVWSYYFKVVDIDTIQLPLFLCSDLNLCNGLFTLKVNDKKGYEAVKVTDITSQSIEISDASFDRAMAMIKEGYLMKCSEEYFRDKFASATEKLFKKVNHR